MNLFKMGSYILHGYNVLQCYFVMVLILFFVILVSFIFILIMILNFVIFDLYIDKS